MDNLKKGAWEFAVRVENSLREMLKVEVSTSTSQTVGWVDVEFKHFYRNPCVLACIVETNPEVYVEVGLKPIPIQPLTPIRLSTPPPKLAPGTLLSTATSGSDKLLVYRAEFFNPWDHVLVYDKDRWERTVVTGVYPPFLHVSPRLQHTYDPKNMAGVGKAHAPLSIRVERSVRPDFAEVFLSKAWDAVIKYFTSWLKEEWTCWSVPCVKCIPFTSICWWDWCTDCGKVYVSYDWLRNQIVKAIIMLAWYAGNCLNSLWDRGIGGALSTIESRLVVIDTAICNFLHKFHLTMQTVYNSFIAELLRAWDVWASALNECVDRMNRTLEDLSSEMGKVVGTVSSTFIEKVSELEGRTPISPAIIGMWENGDGFSWWSPKPNTVLYYFVFESTEV